MSPHVASIPDDPKSDSRTCIPRAVDRIPRVVPETGTDAQQHDEHGERLSSLGRFQVGRVGESEDDKEQDGRGQELGVEGGGIRKFRSGQGEEEACCTAWSLDGADTCALESIDVGDVVGVDQETCKSRTESLSDDEGYDFPPGKSSKERQCNGDARIAVSTADPTAHPDGHSYTCCPCKSSLEVAPVRSYISSCGGMVVQVDLTFNTSTKDEDEESAKELGKLFSVEVTQLGPVVRFQSVQTMIGKPRLAG